MATKAKAKASRAAERKPGRSTSSDRQEKTRAASPNAIELLEQDHREVEEWFDEYDELEEDGRRKAELVQKICTALKLHAQIEEEIFYPRASEAVKEDDLIDDSLVEHGMVKRLIAEIEEMEVGDDLYDAKIRVLGEMAKGHIKDEEEKLFAGLGRSKMDLDAVGEELAQRKKELLAEMER